MDIVTLSMQLRAPASCGRPLASRPFTPNKRLVVRTHAAAGQEKQMQFPPLAKAPLIKLPEGEGRKALTAHGRALLPHCTPIWWRLLLLLRMLLHLCVSPVAAVHTLSTYTQARRTCPLRPACTACLTRTPRCSTLGFHAG